LLNSGIVAPFTRALYGKRIQHPLGPDFGFSSKLISRLVASEGKKRAGGYPRSIASLTVDAACDGFEICQANVGARKYPRTDWLNQSSVLVQILGPLFAEAEVHAAFWQRIRESEPVPVFGETPAAAEADDTDKPDVQRMIETFRLGHSSLQEIWAEVLGPGTLLEMGKLARLAPEQFRMPDRLWARIVYDFALGHRLRFISQDHLLRAMTPLYLAWVASYAIELSIGVTSIDQRLEQLGLAFEQAKPYALSRWRWPDRFNP
jgi:hypothetical protein